MWTLERVFRAKSFEECDVIDPNITPFLFSVGTKMSYRIAKEYYNNVQYVWCSPSFNRKGQPPTSNPLSITRRYLQIISTGDHHAEEIKNNKVGILGGAREKMRASVITQEQNDVSTHIA